MARTEPHKTTHVAQDMALAQQPPLPSWYRGAAAIGHPELFEHARACWTNKLCRHNHNCSFQGEGVVCGVERHAIQLVHAFLPVDAVVLELGARYGTVSCAIDRRIQGSGARLSVEPDIETYTSLTANLHANHCDQGIAVNGAVSRTPLYQYRRSDVVRHTGYGNNKVMERNCSSQSEHTFGVGHGVWKCDEIPTFTVQQLAQQLASSRLHDRPGILKRGFTALVVDCEGCWRRFMADEASFLSDPALEYIFYETDERNHTLIEMTCARFGFGVVHNQLDCMTPKVVGLSQVVFKRGHHECRTAWERCDSSCKTRCGLDEPAG